MGIGPIKRMACVSMLGWLWLLPAPAASQTATMILAQSKEVMGGKAWDAVRTSYTKVKISTGGMTGVGESWTDILTGRYANKFSLGPMSGAEGFDGKVPWSQDSSGQSRPGEGGAAREAAVDEAYRQALAYWFPQRWPAEMECQGEREDQGKHFRVVRITPRGGRPFDLWIDSATFLFDRIVEKGDIETRTTFFTDYRAVEGVKVAFAGRSSNGDTKYDQTFTTDKVQFNVSIEEALFRIPAPPPADFALVGSKTSTTVPFELINNHIYLQVKLNGQGPFRVLCDTGGANIVTPGLAQKLGLKAEGALQGRGVGEKSEDVGLVKVQSLEVGEATLSNQLFAVFPMESLASVEGVTEEGLIGYEVFKRFVVQVDYEHKRLTLTVPSAFAYHGGGVAVPFVFNEQIPQVDGEIDGIPGKFDIDTGSRASIDLLQPFAEKHDLKKRYGAKVEAVSGWGVGGPARALVTRSKLLRLGKVEVKDAITELSLQKKGAFSSPYVAGNVGAGVLKRFNITFDYPHQQLIFERNANDGKPDVFDRSGMWLNLASEGFEVVDVTAGGPAAAAGLKPGDRIGAIDGRPVGELTLPGVRQRFRSDPPGTKLRLTVQSGKEKREIDLVLKDLV